MPYSIMFINHDPAPTQSPELTIEEIDPYECFRPQPGFSLKKAGTRQRVTFTDAQKEIMIAEMVRRGEVPLTD